MFAVFVLHHDTEKNSQNASHVTLHLCETHSETALLSAFIYLRNKNDSYKHISVFVLCRTPADADISLFVYLAHICLGNEGQLAWASS